MKLFVLFVCIGLLSSCTSTKEVMIVKYGDMPETKKIESKDGKGLNDYATPEIQPEVFFESGAKIRSAVLADNGTLYFGNENCEFFAVDIAKRQTLWKYTTDTAVQTWPVIAEGKIIFNAGNSLYILDSMSGDEIQKITYPSKKSLRVSTDGWAFNDSYTAVSDGAAYYVALDGTLAAVDINKGGIIWSIPPLSPGAAASGVNLYNQKLYYVDYFGFVCCVDIKTRQMIFRTELQDRIFAPIYINDGKIYAAGRSCKIYCIDADSGKFIWSSFSYDTTTWFSGGSVSIGDTLYTCTSDEHTVIAFNKNTGDFLRMYPTITNGYTRPTINGDNIIIAAADVYSKKQSHIMEFDTKSHTKRWQAQISDCVLSPPAIYQGVLYFGSDSGKIYCINLK
ncbi:MAG: PQQ-binding-like beta-propeller repeat protein [Treponema sp.]|jgi:outer membrane protein assembly factor BamB|nr:PQQ-binding-like beta-propeller repeat protein [Treponema sp.]